MQSLLEILFGSIILEGLGAFAKWVFLAVKNWISRKPYVSFSKIYDGKKSASLQGRVEHGFSNTLLGVIVIVLICAFLMWALN